jgi:hypothetical protein
MKAIGKTINKATRFALSLLLWAHAVFAINIQSPTVLRIAQVLHLTVAEFVLLSLTIVFSYLASTGFWSAVGNLLYIYFFPFVLLFYAAKWALKLLLVIGRWLNPKTDGVILADKQRPALLVGLRLPGPQKITTVDAIQDQSVRLHLLFRPVRRFTLLWCLLLLLATHTAVIWVALMVILIHIARFFVRLVRVFLGSRTFFERLEEGIQRVADDWLAKIAHVTSDSPPTPELRALWQSIRNFELGILALKDGALLSRWATLLGGVFLGCVYVYVAFVSSFVYYGIERLAGYGDTWPQLLTTALFIPFLLGDLPKLAVLRLLGGLQCLIVLSIGIGTVTRYLRSYVRSLRTVAATVDSRFADDTVKAQYEALKQKFESPTQQLSKFDGDTYDTLALHQTALERAKEQYRSGALPVGSKEAINAATQAFNVAFSSWIAWRNILQCIVKGDQVAAQTKAECDLSLLNKAMTNMILATAAKQSVGG